MPADVDITQVSARPTAAPAQVSQATAASAQGPTDVQSAAASKRPLFNPSLHIDLALNLVVLQFVDDNGYVTNSIPSQKQLKAYREHQPDSHGTTAGPVKP